MKFYLVGYMYCGKTTVGKQLARRLGLHFVDLDVAFESKYHIGIPAFFEQYGEEAFRKLEQQMLHATADIDGVVVSTGGGTACYADNMEFINSHGTSVYLRMDAETLARRAAVSHKPRPLLTLMDDDERRTHITAQLAQRAAYYERAAITVEADCDNPVKVADRIIELSCMC